MSTELFVLDRAERGELCGSLVGKAAARVDKTDANRTSEPVVQVQASVAQVQSEELEQVSGPEGLARLKDYDRRFAFYPSFSVERSLALEFRAQGISRLSMEIRALRRELKSENASEVSHVASTDVTEERLQGLISQLTEELAQYGGQQLRNTPSNSTEGKTNSNAKDAAWIHAQVVDNAEAPQQSSLDQLRLWLDQRSIDQLEMYRNKEWHEFRLLASAKGPIEKLVKAFMPLSRLGRLLLRPFRSHSVHIDSLQFLRYEDAVLSWVVSVLLLVGICVFLVLPLALLSYFDTDRNIRIALVLVMCFLVSVFARVIETDEARQVVFVCVYSAVLSGFLSQAP